MFKLSDFNLIFAFNQCLGSSNRISNEQGMNGNGRGVQELLCIKVTADFEHQYLENTMSSMGPLRNLICTWGLV